LPPDYTSSGVVCLKVAAALAGRYAVIVAGTSADDTGIENAVVAPADG
jgi:hypothetical protein